MAELVDATDSKSVELRFMSVRVGLGVPFTFFCDNVNLIMSKRSYYDYLGYKCNQYLFTPLIIITFVYFFFFEFNLGKLIFINFFGEGIKNLINNFEYSFFSVFKTIFLIFSFLIMSLFIIVLGGGFSMFIVGFPLFSICGIFSVILNFFDLPNFNKIVDNFNERKKGRKNVESGEKFDLNMIEEKWVPKEFRWELSNNFIEEIEAELNFYLQIHKNKFKTESKFVNNFLKFKHPLSIGEYYFSNFCCEHNIADELYCRDCERNIIKRKNSFKRFLDHYKKIKSNSSFNSEKKKKLYTDFAIDPKLLEDLKFFGLTNNFTIEELKTKRNLLIKINHPDKVSEMSREIKNVANKQTLKINDTYNRLLKYIKKKT